MTTMIRLLIVLLLVLCTSQGRLRTEAATADLWPLLSAGGRAVLMRHAMAPGFGDPPTFTLGDCSTQRNLSEAGREQARRIGAIFRHHGVKIDNIYTSQWCRCRETATLLGLGPVQPLPILNSFFQHREDERQQTEALEQFLTTTPISGVIVLVTHQVNITALTGMYPASGEAVVVDPQGTTTLRVLGKLSFAPG